MSPRNRRVRRQPNSLPPPPDRAALQSFYESSAELVEQQFAAAFEDDLRAAVGLVQSVEGDRWSW